MAISRYDQYTRFQPQDNYFRLDYEMMAAPILKADKEFQDLDAKTFETIQTFADQEVLPGDMPDLESRLTKLRADEAAFREKSGGNILDPMYRDAMKDRFLGEVGDSWYKQTAWTKTQAEERQKIRNEFIAKNGYAPMDWQDPDLDYWNNFESTAISGAAPLASGIIPKLPFYPKAAEYLQPSVTKKLENGEFFVLPGPNGTVKMINRNKAEMTKEELKEILWRNSSLMNSPETDQMKLDYQERLAKGLINAKDFPTFDSYLDSEIESIVRNLAYQWYEEKGSLINTPSGDGSSGSTRTSSRDSVLKGFSGYQGDGTKAGAPIYAPRRAASRSLANQARQKQEQLRSSTDPRVKSIPNATELVSKDLRRAGLNGNVSIELREGTTFGGYEEPSLMVDYEGENGERESFNILAPDGLLKADKMGLSNDSYQMLYQIGTEYAAETAKLLEHEDFRMRAIDAAFTEEGKADAILEYGFYQGYLDNKEKQQVLERSGLDIMDRIASGENIAALLRTSGPVNQGISAASDAAALEAGISQESGNEPVNMWMAKKLENLFTSLDGVVPDGYIGDAKYQYMQAYIKQKIDEAGGSGKARNIYAYEILEDATEEYLVDTDDPYMEKFENVYINHWETGIDAQMQPKSDDRERSGIRAVPKTLLHINFIANTQSDKWEEGFTEVVDDLIFSSVPAKGSMKATFGEVTLFRQKDDVALTGAEVGELLKVEDGKKNWTARSIYFDDTGLSLQVNVTNDDGQMETYEIRNMHKIFKHMEEAGVQHVALLRGMDQMLRDFQDEDLSETSDPGKTSASIHRLGQTRGKVATTVDIGNYSRPVYRVPHDGGLGWIQKDMEGRELKEGEFVYYSLANKKYNVYDSPLQVMLDIYKDKALFEERITGLTEFNESSFSDNVNVPSHILKEGTNTMSKEIFDGVNFITEQADYRTAFGDNGVKITSAHRDRGHELSLQNPKSYHIWYDAVDFSVRGNDGKIDDRRVKFFYDNRYALQEKGYNIQFEFKTAGSDDYRRLKAKYPDFVTVEPNAKGPHVHLEYDRNDFFNLNPE